MRSFLSFSLARYYQGRQINEGETGGVRGGHGEEEKCILAAKFEVYGPAESWCDIVNIKLRETGWKGFSDSKMRENGGLL
jgi:hypothetical protein